MYIQYIYINYIVYLYGYVYICGPLPVLKGRSLQLHCSQPFMWGILLRGISSGRVKDRWDQKAAATSAFTQYRPTLSCWLIVRHSQTLGETCWNGNTKLQRNIFPCETVMMAPRLKTAEVQPSTLAKFVEPFFLVWNSMDAHDFVLEHFAENAIHPRKDHWWFGLKQITRYSAHGTTWLRPKTGHTQFMAMAIKKCGNTFAKIHWNRAHFSDKATMVKKSTYFQLRWVPQERNVVLIWQQTQLSDLIPYGT